MKIPIGRMEQTEIQLALPDLRPAGPKTTTFWQNQTLTQPAAWTIKLRSPNRMLSAEYLEGNAFASIKQGKTPTCCKP